MASSANSLRLCLRNSSQVCSIRATRPRALVVRRTLSTSAGRSYAAKNSADTEDEPEHDQPKRFYNNLGEVLASFSRDQTVSKNERQQAIKMLADWNQLPRDQLQDLEKIKHKVGQDASELRRPVVLKRNGENFWNEEEPDQDYLVEETGEDEFDENDILSMAHGKLEEHREAREYARIAVWEMPLLSSKPSPRIILPLTQ
jgi:small subunit ribosomal protein S35